MDDPLIKALAREARQQRSREPDPRWDAVADRSLDPTEAAALRAEAGASPEGRDVVAAFTPLRPEVRARIRERVRKELGHEEAASEPWFTGFFRRLFRPLAIAVPIAAAATVATILWWPDAAGPVLPGYDVTLHGGESVVRGTAGDRAPIRLGPDSLLEVRLRPGTAFDGPVAVLGLAVRDGRARLLPSLRVPMPAGACPSCTVRTEPGGFVRILGRSTELLGLDAGVWELVFAVAPGEYVPSGDEVVAAIDAGHVPEGRSWRLAETGSGRTAIVDIVADR
jgi:hypothetical protein